MHRPRAPAGLSKKSTPMRLRAGSVPWCAASEAKPCGAGLTQRNAAHAMIAQLAEATAFPPAT